MTKEEMRIYLLNRRKRLSAEKRCISCTRQDQRTLDGRCWCKKCSDRQSANARLNRQRKKIIDKISKVQDAMQRISAIQEEAYKMGMTYGKFVERFRL